jgi:hypothetical protein
MDKNGLYGNLDNYIRNTRNEFENKLAALVETPSISSDPERVGDQPLRPDRGSVFE